MSTRTRIAAVLATLGLAYPATAWFLGARVDAELVRQYQQLAAQPYLKVVERDMARGVFSSTERVTVEVNGALLRELSSLGGDGEEPTSGGSAEEASALRFTLVSQIQHGPLPGLRAVAAALSETSLELDDATRQRLASVLGERSPLAVQTVFRFDGGGSTTLDSPAFSLKLPDSEGGTWQLEWGGVHMSVDFARGLARYTLQGAAPRLVVADRTARLTVSGMAFDADQTRVFEDDPVLYQGTQTMRIAAVQLDPVGDTAAGAVKVQELEYALAMPVNGEFADLTARLGAKGVSVAEREFGPAHYDLSLRHLHARTLAAVSRAMMDLYARDAAVVTADADPADALVAAAKGLLAHSPELSLDRLSFGGPHGEASLSLRVSLGEGAAGVLDNPMALLDKLEVSGKLAVPEGGLKTLGDDLDAALVEEQLADFAAKGLVRREQGVARADFDYRGGTLRVNGREVDPFALAGGAQP